jgi:hypothetical protein
MHHYALQQTSENPKDASHHAMSDLWQETKSLAKVRILTDLGKFRPIRFSTSNKNQLRPTLAQASLPHPESRISSHVACWTVEWRLHPQHRALLRKTETNSEAQLIGSNYGNYS